MHLSQCNFDRTGNRNVMNVMNVMNRINRINKNIHDIINRSSQEHINEYYIEIESAILKARGACIPFFD